MSIKNEIRRIDFLLKHINLIENDLNTKSLEDFRQHDLLVRATSFSLVQIGEQMNRLEEDLREKYPDVPWSDARSMRNIIVHVYSKVDADQVYKTAKTDLGTLKTAFTKIKEDLLKQI